MYKKTEAGKDSDKRRRSKPETKEHLKSKRLEYRYGLSKEQYQQMVTDQQGKCLICEEPQTHLHVDHDHKSNKVRGLLCGSCNRGLGMFKDSSLILIRASKYLKRK